MILEGVKLMIIGMVIVYVFLLVLMLSVNLSAMLFKDGDVRSSDGSAKPGKARKNIVPIIAAAVLAYRAKRASED